MGTVAAANIVLACLFGGWIVAFDTVAIIYLINIYHRRDNFQIRLKLPSLWILEGVVYDMAPITTQGLREVFAALGRSFPNKIQDFSLVLFLVVFAIISPIRPIQLIILYDPALRRAYYPYLKRVKIMLFLTIPMVLAISYWATEQSRRAGCMRMSVKEVVTSPVRNYLAL